ncbi:MAG: flippase-like domain-containing protein [Pararobbsia sp.]
MRHAATVLACVGVGLAMASPFVLGSHALLAGLRAISPDIFMILAACAVVSAGAKAGKQHLMQAALGLRLRFSRTFTMTVVTDSAFLVSPLGAAGYGVNMALLERSGASWGRRRDDRRDRPGARSRVFHDRDPDLAAARARAARAGLPEAQRAHRVRGAAGRGPARLPALVQPPADPRRAGLDRPAHSVAQVAMGRLTHFGHHVRQQFALLRAGPPQRFIALLIFTTMQWLPRYGALWFILYARGYHLPFGFVLAVQAVILHLALWTGVPAGGGSGDLGLAAAFAAWVPAAALGTTLVLWRFATLYCPLFLGAAGLAVLALQRRKKA